MIGLLVKFVVRIEKIFYFLNISVVKNHLTVLFIKVNKGENKVLRLLLSGAKTRRQFYLNVTREKERSIARRVVDVYSWKNRGTS